MRLRQEHSQRDLWCATRENKDFPVRSLSLSLDSDFPTQNTVSSEEENSRRWWEKTTFPLSLFPALPCLLPCVVTRSRPSTRSRLSLESDFQCARQPDERVKVLRVRDWCEHIAYKYFLLCYISSRNFASGERNWTLEKSVDLIRRQRKKTRELWVKNEQCEIKKSSDWIEQVKWAQHFSQESAFRWRKRISSSSGLRKRRLKSVLIRRWRWKRQRSEMKNVRIFIERAREMWIRSAYIQPSKANTPFVLEWDFHSHPKKNPIPFSLWHREAYARENS